MHSFVPVAVAVLAPFAAASALPEILDFSVLISRQAPGTPAYECHSDCGNVIVGGRTEGYCDDATWQEEFQGCMECAYTYDIWQYYGTSVTTAAEACGLAVNPSPSGSVATSTAAAETTTSAAAATTTDAEEATTTAAATSAVETTSTPEETTAGASTVSAAETSAAVSSAASSVATEVASTTSAGSVGTSSAISSASATSTLVTVSGASKQGLAIAFGALASAVTAALLM